MKCITTFCGETAAIFYIYHHPAGRDDLKHRCIDCYGAYGTHSRKTILTEQEYITQLIEARLQATEPRG